METAGPGDEWRDRSVSTGRTKTPDHAQLSRSVGKISESDRDHNEEPSGDARHRSPRRARSAQRISGERFGDVAPTRDSTRARAANFVALGAARSRGDLARGGNSRWRDGGPDYSWSDRS